MGDQDQCSSRSRSPNSRGGSCPRNSSRFSARSMRVNQWHPYGRHEVPEDMNRLWNTQFIPVPNALFSGVENMSGQRFNGPPFPAAMPLRPPPIYMDRRTNMFPAYGFMHGPSQHNYGGAPEATHGHPPSGFPDEGYIFAPPFNGLPSPAMLLPRTCPCPPNHSANMGVPVHGFMNGPSQHNPGDDPGHAHDHPSGGFPGERFISAPPFNGLPSPAILPRRPCPPNHSGNMGAHGFMNGPSQHNPGDDSGHARDHPSGGFPGEGYISAPPFNGLPSPAILPRRPCPPNHSANMGVPAHGFMNGPSQHNPGDDAGHAHDHPSGGFPGERFISAPPFNGLTSPAILPRRPCPPNHSANMGVKAYGFMNGPSHHNPGIAGGMSQLNAPWASNGHPSSGFSGEGHISTPPLNGLSSPAILPLSPCPPNHSANMRVPAHGFMNGPSQHNPGDDPGHAHDHPSGGFPGERFISAPPLNGLSSPAILPLSPCPPNHSANMGVPAHGFMNGPSQHNPGDDPGHAHGHPSGGFPGERFISAPPLNGLSSPAILPLSPCPPNHSANMGVPAHGFMNGPSQHNPGDDPGHAHGHPSGGFPGERFISAPPLNGLSSPAILPLSPCPPNHSANMGVKAYEFMNGPSQHNPGNAGGMSQLNAPGVSNDHPPSGLSGEGHISTPALNGLSSPEIWLPGPYPLNHSANMGDLVNQPPQASDRAAVSACKNYEELGYCLQGNKCSYLHENAIVDFCGSGTPFDSIRAKLELLTTATVSSRKGECNTNAPCLEPGQKVFKSDDKEELLMKNEILQRQINAHMEDLHITMRNTSQALLDKHIAEQKELLKKLIAVEIDENKRTALKNALNKLMDHIEKVRTDIVLPAVQKWALNYDDCYAEAGMYQNKTWRAQSSSQSVSESANVAPNPMHNSEKVVLNDTELPQPNAESSNTRTTQKQALPEEFPVEDQYLMAAEDYCDDDQTE